MAQDRRACGKCGVSILEGIPYCPHCGARQPSPLSRDDLERNPYQILQVASTADADVIEAAYKSLAKKYHPDRALVPDADERMKELNWAHDILTDPAKRREWDRKHSQQQAVPSANQAPDSPSPGVSSAPSPAKSPPPPPPPTSAAPPVGSGPNPTVMLLAALGLILVCVVALIVAGPQSTASPTHPAPSPTHRRFPTNTPRPAAPLPIPASPTPSCTPWWEITLADVGTHMCVYGDVYLPYDDGQAYFVTFSSFQDAFYVLSYDVSLPDLRSGDCIRVVGEIDHLGNAPVMVIGWASEVTDCY
jgi:hypothetical protein